MLTRPSRRSLLALAAAASASLLAPRAMGQSFALQHAASIDLSASFFGPGAMGEPASDFGWNPLGVAFDGTNAYVGGFNGGSISGNAGIVKVNNLLSTSSSVTPLNSTVFSANPLRGVDYISSDGTAFYAVYDDGLGTGFVRRYDSAGTQQWSVTPAADIVAGYRPSTIAIDPLADNGSPALGMVGIGSGRRTALRLSDGSVIFGPSGSPFPLGEIINPNPSSVNGVNLGFTYRGIAFDSQGNIAVGAQGGGSYAQRDTQGGTNFNRFVNLDGVSSATTPIAAKQQNTDPAGFVGQGMGFVEGLGGQTLLALSSRVGTPFALELRSAVAGVPAHTGLDSRDVHILSTTGDTPTDLLNPTLSGNEDGIGAAAWDSDIKGIATGRDPNNNPVLLVLSFTDRRLDVYNLEPAWNVPGSGVWSNASNWFANVVPGSALDNARFGSAITAFADITVDGPKTLKRLIFDNANTYRLTGGGAITLDSAGTPLLDVLSGNHLIIVPVTLAKDTTVNVVTGGSLGVSRFSGAGLTIDSGKVQLLLADLPTTTTVTSLNLAGGTTPTATLDITNNAVVVDYTPPPSGPDAEPFDTIKAQITFAYNNGAWDNDGITSSQANASQFGIGYAEASNLPSIPAIFGTVDADAVLLRFTRYGDANLDGSVTLADFNRLAANFGASGANWDQGDFNYDSIVNLSDFNRLAANFGLSVPTDPTPADWAALASAVPEPSATGLLYALGLLLGRRRR